MSFLLYLFADTFFYVACEHDGGKNYVKQEIQCPGNRVAKHDCAEFLAKGVNELHPKHTEAQVDGDVCNACQHGIAKGLHRTYQHCADGIEENKQHNIEQAEHSVIDGHSRGHTDNETQPKSAGQVGENTQRSGDHGAVHQAEPKCLFHPLRIVSAYILTHKSHTGASESCAEGIGKGFHGDGSGVTGDRIGTVGIDSGSDLEISQRKDQV